MKKRNLFTLISLSLMLALDILIIVESSIGGAGSSTQSQGFTQTVINIITVINPNNQIQHHPEEAHALIRKIVGHFLLFGASGLLTSIPFVFDKNRKKRSLEIFIVVLLKGLLLAILTEFIQYFTPGRAGMLTDVLIDFAGYTLFALISLLIIIYTSSIHKQSTDIN